MKIPSDVIELHEAADKYGFTWAALRTAIYRKRLKGFKMGTSWFSTRRDVAKYIETRDTNKIPHSYRKKIVR
ncbi:MAG: hypothetical protein EXS63_03880 [Candidatus Omnitrophica bacterium]|nr:hypothetical protein [Candidatus Omnitrophota bacterium]